MDGVLLERASRVCQVAVDARITMRNGKEATIGDFFGAKRARGICAHGGSKADDEIVARRLVECGRQHIVVADRQAILGSSGVDRSPLAKPAGTPEENVDPDPVLGVAEGMFPRVYSCSPFACPPEAGDAARLFGTYSQMVADIVGMGAGHVRRVKFADVYWGSVFPDEAYHVSAFQGGKKVPPPSEILADLRGNDYAVLGYLSAFLDACLVAGLRVSLTPFHSGGGSPYSMNLTDTGAINSDTDGPNDGVGWEEVIAAMPSYHNGARAPGGHGWNKWYWDLSLDGVTEEKKTYQKYCIRVWPTRSEDFGQTSTTYTRECSRRKGLGIAAFCTGIAEFLVRYNEALQEWSHGDFSIYDIVEFIELGNELDGLYVIPAHVQGQFEEPQNEQDEAAALSEREGGRYMALIAGPFRRLLPLMKFRAAELLSSAPIDPVRNSDGTCDWTSRFRQRCEWVREAIRVGMKEEVQLWDSLQGQYVLKVVLLGLSTDELEEWLETCESAGWYWPPLPTDDGLLGISVTDLVHEAGFHWYHGYNFKSERQRGVRAYTESPYLYFDAQQLSDDVDTFRSDVVDELATAGFDVEISVGEIGFAAAWPEGNDAADIAAPYYLRTSEEFQAAMVVRLLAVLRAKLVGHAYWFNHMLKPIQADDAGISWTSGVSATGLHNDIFGASRSGYDDFQARGAYRRPAWFSYRRLVWLLSLAAANGVTIVVNDRGKTAIRIRFSHAASEGPGGVSFGTSYRYAWIIWLDQYCDSLCHHTVSRWTDETTTSPASVSIDDTESRGYVFVSLVPQVDVDFAAREVDENGYKAVADVRWHWGRNSEWRSAIDTVYGEMVNDDGRTYLQFTLSKADTLTAIAPICVLTNASELWMG